MADSTFCANISKFILILINLGFIAAGSLLIWLSVEATDSGWLDVFEGEYAYLKDTIFWIILTFGVVVILIALMGCVGAMKTNRCLLACYTFFVVFALIFFLLITILGFMSKGVADDWNDTEYPADEESEPVVAENFNKVYCYSQGSYYCNNPISEISNLINVTIPSTAETNKSIIEICNVLKDQIPSNFQSFCDACSISEPYEKYNKVYDWTQEKCKPSTASTTWCLKFLINGDEGEKFSGAPYGECRTPFLDSWSEWSNAFAVIALIFSLASLAIIILVCVSKRKQSSAYRSHA